MGSTAFNTASISPVQLLGVDGQTPAAIDNPVPVALASGTTAHLSAVSISFSAISTAVIVTGVATTSIRVFRMILNNTTATTLTFKDNATALTGPLSFAANSMFILGFEGEPWFTASTAANFGIQISVTSQINGILYYTQV